MRLIHTLLFLFRENKLTEDINMAATCLKSLEKSTFKTVVVYNQGYFSNEKLQEFLKPFQLNFHVIGDGANVGTTVGRQSCFRFIWENFPDTEYISEIHLDMLFTWAWEDMLVSYLDTHDEPVISCGIVDQRGNMPFLNKTAAVPDSNDKYDDFLANLREDSILHGFTNPCVHASKALKETGGYNSLFLKGKQCFEDDSLLLGYYYYFGTRANWHPKINFNSIVYHAIAGQRLDISGNVMVNFNGLIKQYGAMGLKHLSDLHKSAWHKKFFLTNYNKITAN